MGTEMEEIAGELVRKIEGLVCNTDGVLDPQRVLQEFALEAVGCVFMGTRLGAMTGQGDGQRLIELTEQSFQLAGKLIPLPQGILPYLPAFKKWVEIQEECFDICKKHVESAIGNIKETDESLLAKLV